MEKQPIPIGRGEQIGLEKSLGDIAGLTEQIKELGRFLLEIRKQIEQSYAEEMKKPEWARRQSVLDQLKKDFEENDSQIDALLNNSSNIQSALDYVERRNEELEKRIKEEGY
jgi:chromosome segregation ATPase